MDKGGRVHRHRGYRAAIRPADGAPSLKPTPCAEDRDGYALMSAKLDGLRPVLVVMEATGHYWRNLFAALEFSETLAKAGIQNGRRNERIIFAR